MYLDKRDNMGFQIAPSLIIFLVILGSGGLVVCGFAVMRFFNDEEAAQPNYGNRSIEQDRYMREVRERTWGKLPRYYIQPQAAGNNLPHDGQSVNASNTTYG